MTKFYLVLATCLFVHSIWAGHDDQDIEGEAETRGFIVGSDADLGGDFFYIVDRTNKLCFAGIKYQDGSGFTEVDCDKLVATKTIKTFYEGVSVKKGKKQKKKKKKVESEKTET